MTRRVHLQLSAITSDDGTRCAAECPHLSSSWCECTSFRAVVMRHEGGYLRAAACIAAEQAAASVPSCEGARGLDASEALRGTEGGAMTPDELIEETAFLRRWNRLSAQVHVDDYADAVNSLATQLDDAKQVIVTLRATMEQMRRERDEARTELAAAKDAHGVFLEATGRAALARDAALAKLARIREVAECDYHDTPRTVLRIIDEKESGQ